MFIKTIKHVMKLLICVYAFIKHVKQLISAQYELHVPDMCVQVETGEE